MNRFFYILEKVKLFGGISEKELSTMLNCLDAKRHDYAKDEFIFQAGDRVDSIGILLKGSAHIMKESYQGDRTILSVLEEGDYFAEALCCAGIQESPVSVQVRSDAVVLTLNFSRILHTCSRSCSFHTKLIENMMYILANKNIALQSHFEVISRKSMREKILGYLHSLAVKQGNTISIPLNREEFADYLCVDRSALSHELARMKSNGIIDYHKNTFRLL